MHNSSEIKFFFLKVASWCHRPSSNLFIILVELSGPGLPYGTVPDPYPQMITLFLVFTYIWQEDVAKISKISGAPRNVIRTGNTMVTKRNHLLYHFSTIVHLHLASFYAQNTLKKYLGNMLIEQISALELRGPGALVVHVLLKLVNFITKQKSLR